VKKFIGTIIIISWKSLFVKPYVKNRWH